MKYYDLIYAENVLEKLTTLLEETGGFYIVMVRGELGRDALKWVTEIRNSNWSDVKTDVLEWPGTRVFTKRQAATMLRCKVCPNSINLLRKAPSNIWEWLKPHWAEDLSFLHEDGTAWFTSISHERSAYFTASEEFVEQIESVLGKNALGSTSETVNHRLVKKSW